ncbi:hypothetical protein Fmac_026541 [Flemingia macrophylla]|uniref:Uncharacterized protein n=1 Tax=Flemingia macrophylla TaxID=520843 RepID=A0ABD1LF70_9FABA
MTISITVVNIDKVEFNNFNWTQVKFIGKGIKHQHSYLKTFWQMCYKEDSGNLPRRKIQQPYVLSSTKETWEPSVQIN